MSKFLSTYRKSARWSTWARLVNKTDEIHFLVEFDMVGWGKQDKYENDKSVLKVICATEKR